MTTYLTGVAIPGSWQSPYATATFTDIAPGTVQLKMQATGLFGTGTPDGPYQIAMWYFNVVSSWTQTDLNQLVFAYQPALSTANNVLSASDISRHLDNKKVDPQVGGDIYFDLLIEWKCLNATVTECNNPSPFYNGDQVVYNITYTGLKAFDANVFNAPSFGNTLYYSAIKTKGDSPETYLGGTTSRTTTSVVPEPATLVLLGIGLVGVAAARRRSRD